MRALTARLVLAAVIALPVTAHADLDHYSPGALAARARELAEAGDLGTASILLARAERIAPGDARVARAREALAALADGKAPAPEPPKVHPPAQSPASHQSSAMPSTPPAPWRLP